TYGSPCMVLRGEAFRHAELARQGAATPGATGQRASGAVQGQGDQAEARRRGAGADRGRQPGPRPQDTRTHREEAPPRGTPAPTPSRALRPPRRRGVLHGGGRVVYHRRPEG